MGGWVIISGDTGPIEKRVKKFTDVFRVPGVPDIHIDVKSYQNDFHVLLWSWSNFPVPDIDVSYKEGDNELLLLHGIITDLGRFGSLTDNQAQSGSKILELWTHQRDKIISELNGSFSCAFYNLQERCITLFSDRFASRSIWFSRENKTWYCGNFPAAIAALRLKPPHLDAVGVWSLFAYSRQIKDHGIYHEISNVPAAQKLELGSDGKFKMYPWWQLSYKPNSNISPKEWAAQIAHYLRESAGRLQKLKPEINLFLSGGLDSRIAAGAFGSDIKTTTLTTHHNMNSKIAEKVANHLKIKHKTVIRTPYWYLDSFQAAALMSGGNYNLQHAHFIVPVQQMKNIDHHSAFALGDLLENFNKHYVRPVNGEYPQFKPEEIPEIFHKVYPYCNPSLEQLGRLFRPKIAEKMRDNCRQTIMEASRNVSLVSEDSRDCFDTLFRWNNCNTSPTYLMFECIRPLSSECNIMFDNNLLDLLLKIPASVRGKGILHRWTLWHLSKGLVLIPDSNFWVPPFFPNRMKKPLRRIRSVFGKARRKMTAYYSKGPIVKTEGSWHMLHEWYRKDKNYKYFIEDCLFDDDTLPSDIFNHDEIKTCWKEFLNGKISRKFDIDMLLSFGLLHKRIRTSRLNIF